MGLCYLLLIANGFAPLRGGGGDEVHSGEAWTAEDRQLLRQCINVARWWIEIAIDCALALQGILDLNTRSVKNGMLAAFGEKVKHISAVEAARLAAFCDFEARHAGEQVAIEDLREESVFAPLGRATLNRLVGDRHWVPTRRGRYLIPEQKEETP